MCLCQSSRLSVAVSVSDSPPWRGALRSDHWAKASPGACEHRRKHRGDVRRSIWKSFCRAPYRAMLAWSCCLITFLAAYAMLWCFLLFLMNREIASKQQWFPVYLNILTLEVRSGCHSSCWRIDKNNNAIDSSCKTTLRDITQANTHTHIHTERERDRHRYGHSAQTVGRHARRLTTFELNNFNTS